VKKVDIYELGESTIKALFDAGVIQQPSDLYKMVEKDITPITGGARSAEKIVKSVQSKREVSLDIFIGGLDFSGNFGETLAKTVMDNGFDTLEKMEKATVAELSAIKGIGEITAKALKDGLKENAAEIKELLKLVKITAPVAPVKGGKLDGKSFCFTGKLDTMGRSDAEALVRSLGGIAKSSVAKGLTYLVTNDTGSGSSKNKKAEELGTEVIDEKTFLSMTK
jgi:DNA ligase (NAD+)